MMDLQFTRLLDALGQAGRPAPVDVLAFLQGLPDASALPSPWETWTLIGFVRHRARQYWVRDIIHTRLKGNCAALGAKVRVRADGGCNRSTVDDISGCFYALQRAF